MTKTRHGIVSSVRADILGDSLATAFTATTTTGPSTLSVYDVADFAEEGGTLVVGPFTVDYTGVDDDTGTITLAAPIHAASGSVTVDVDTEVQIYDETNGQLAVRYYAAVSSIDGSSAEPVDALVDQGLVHALVQASRGPGSGESVLLAYDDSQLKVVGLTGRAFALAALQYLQGGITTRQNDDQPGVDIVGGDTAEPGIYIFGTNGTIIVIHDDGSEGVIEFGTGAAGETRGKINPGIDGTGDGYHFIDVLTSKAASPHDTPGHLQLRSSYAGVPPSLACLNGLLLIANDIDCNGILAQTIVSTGSIRSESGGIFMDDLAGGSATTATINASGRIVRTPSSERYKDDVEPLTLDQARRVLELQPVTFKLKDESDNPERRTYPGFIAEQAAGVGLELFVSRDTEGQPDGFRYAELTAPLLMLVRGQRDEISELQERLGRLEALVATLTKPA